MRRPTIKLQHPDKSFYKFITSSELATLLEKKEAFRVTARKSKDFIYRMTPEPEAIRTIDEASPPSITSSDMQANVGLCESRNRIKQAQAKVHIFGEDRLVATFA